MLVEQALFNNKNFLDTVPALDFETVKIALDQFIMMILLDSEGRIVNANAYFCQMMNYSLGEIRGQTYKIFHSGHHTGTFYQEIVNVIENGQKWTGKISIKERNGGIIWVKASISPIGNEFGAPYRYVVALIDVTEYQNVEKWEHMACHDELTGLPNRRRLNTAFNSIILSANKSKSKFAVFFLDINHFKYINDSYGHLIGDKLLKEVGLRLKTLFSNGDCVFRFGGDEFVILLNNFEKLEEKAEAIIALFKKPFIIDSHRFHASTRIGISIFPEHSIYQDELMKYADIAMLNSKRKPRSYQIYHFSMENNHF